MQTLKTAVLELFFIEIHSKIIAYKEGCVQYNLIILIREDCSLFVDHL